MSETIPTGSMFDPKAPLLEFRKEIDGKWVTGTFDVIDGKFDYRGDLPIADAARLLFEQLAVIITTSVRTPWWLDLAAIRTPSTGEEQ
jgi:hypothetical protein